MENTEDKENLDEQSQEDILDDEEIDEEDIEIVALDEEGRELEEEEEEVTKGPGEDQEAREDYVRLYAEFENYKRRVTKDKEEMARFANESIVLDLLPSLDNLEIALKHSRENPEDPEAPKDGLVQGVEMTLRELLRTLEKYGVKQIEAEGKAFDPEFHHAVSQAEREDIEEGMVVEELRRGYAYNGKIIRASMVSVSKAPEKEPESEEESGQQADE